MAEPVPASNESSDEEPFRVTVVRTTGCHFCDDAQDALVELGRRFPLDVEMVDAGSPRGEALVRELGAGMFPLVLVDGVFLSSGRLPRGKLRAVLDGASRGRPSAALLTGLTTNVRTSSAGVR